MADNAPGGSVSQYQLVCAAIAVAPVFYVGAAYALFFSGALPEEGFGDLDPGTTSVLTLALLVSGVTSSLASLLLRKLLGRNPAFAESAGRFRVVMVSMAVAESGAVMGLVLLLLTGNLVYGSLLCGLSFAVTCFHFPSRYWLEHGDNTL